MTDPRWLDAEEHTMWRSYLESTRLLFRALDRQLERDSDISLADYEILVLLSEAPQHRVRMHQIADAMTATRGGATRAVSRLVEAGWVRRVGCADDRRGSLAELTDAGAAKLADAAPNHVAAVRAHVFDLLSRVDLDRFTRFYTAMGEGLRDGGPH